MKKAFKFYTFGCKTNQYETQAIREGLISLGSFTESTQDKGADVYIINTCTVTAKADRDSRWSIRHCRKENPNARIVVTGCLAEMDGDMIKGLPGVSYIVKNNQKHRIGELLNRFTANSLRCTLIDENRKPIIGNQNVYTPLKITDFEGRTKAFIKIQDGCDNKCSYCKIPLVRGRSRSRDLTSILEEIKGILDKGFKELVLTGICLGDWGKGLKEGLRLSDLIERIVAIDKDFRVRLSSIEPNMITDDLIRVIAKNSRVCPHLHIPLQSGSNRILRLMNRPYTAKGYMKIIDGIRKTIPDISITSDVMVGFPGEKKRDFNYTYKILRHIMPSRLHIFSYSVRRGTQASRYESDLDYSEVKRRRKLLEDIAVITSYKYRRRFLGKRVEGLVETERDPKTHLLTGYTARYIKFLLDGPDSLKGKIIPLKAHKLDLKSTYCIHL